MKTIAMILAMVAGVAGAAAQAQDPAGVPVPTGTWSLDTVPGMCVISHGYAAGNSQSILAFRAQPTNSLIEAVLMRDGTVSAPSGGTGRVTLEPGGMTLTGDSASGPTAGGGRRIDILYLKEPAWAGLATATAMTMALDGQAPIRLAVNGADKAIAALRTCRDSLMQSWGMDPTERDRVAEPARPVGSSLNWVSTADYPSDAMKAKQAGTSTIAWTITLDGRAEECRTVVSSGTPSLDAAACAAITKRARYTPAMGKDGKQTVTHVAQMVTWTLPVQIRAR